MLHSCTAVRLVRMTASVQQGTPGGNKCYSDMKYSPGTCTNAKCLPFLSFPFLSFPFLPFLSFPFLSFPFLSFPLSGPTTSSVHADIIYLCLFRSAFRPVLYSIPLSISFFRSFLFRFVLFCFVPFCFVPFTFVLFCFVSLFLFCFISFRFFVFVLFRFVRFISVLFRFSVLFALSFVSFLFSPCVVFPFLFRFLFFSFHFVLFCSVSFRFVSFCLLSLLFRSSFRLVLCSIPPFCLLCLLFRSSFRPVLCSIPLLICFVFVPLSALCCVSFPLSISFLFVPFRLVLFRFVPFCFVLFAFSFVSFLFSPCVVFHSSVLSALSFVSFLFSPCVVFHSSFDLFCCRSSFRPVLYSSTSEEHHFQTSEFRGTIQMPSNSDMALPRRMNPRRFRRCTPPELCDQVLKYRWRSPSCNFNRHRTKKLFTCLTIVRRGVVHLAPSQSRLAGQDGNVKLPQSDRRNLPRAEFHRVGLPSRLNWS